MKITSQDQITFENQIVDNRINYQDIVFNSKVIGAICEWSEGFLAPIKVRYQVLTKLGLESKFDGWVDSEDEGFFIGYFYKLEDFINYFNSQA